MVKTKLDAPYTSWTASLSSRDFRRVDRSDVEEAKLSPDEASLSPEANAEQGSAPGRTASSRQPKSKLRIRRYDSGEGQPKIRRIVLW